MGASRALVAGSVLAAVIAAGPSVPANADVEVDLQLALAVDVSRSIDYEEAWLQRQGYIGAFRHPSVIEAIQYGYLGRIAVSYYEWAGYGHMKVIAGWTIVEDEASANAFADKLKGEPPQGGRRTALGDAIDYGVPFFDDNGFNSHRKVIDVSGDGPANWGRMVTFSRDDAVAAGITINGLPIVNDRNSGGRWNIPDLDLYYRDCVIGGQGAFYVVANEFKDFALAVRRKLILEIAGRTPVRPAIVGKPAAPPSMPRRAIERVSSPCDIGFLMRRYYEDDFDNF